MLFECTSGYTWQSIASSQNRPLPAPRRLLRASFLASKQAVAWRGGFSHESWTIVPKAISLADRIGRDRLLEQWAGFAACGPAFQRVQPAGRPAAGRDARPTNATANSG